MQYLRCKCGKLEAWTSMGGRRCKVCDECGSDLAESPDLHRDPPDDHDFKDQGYSQKTGEKLPDKCWHCGAVREDAVEEANK